MSLASLRKCAPSDLPARKPVSVDEFINDSLVYAIGGQHTDAPCHENTGQCTPMRRATFTLSESCIAQLSAISESTGIPRSKLLRQWISDHYQSQLPDKVIGIIPAKLNRSV